MSAEFQPGLKASRGSVGGGGGGGGAVASPHITLPRMSFLFPPLSPTASLSTSPLKSRNTKERAGGVEGPEWRCYRKGHLAFHCT